MKELVRIAGCLALIGLFFVTAVGCMMGGGIGSVIGVIAHVLIFITSVGVAMVVIGLLISWVVARFLIDGPPDIIACYATRRGEDGYVRQNGQDR